MGVTGIDWRRRIGGGSRPVDTRNKVRNYGDLNTVPGGTNSSLLYLKSCCV